MALVNWRFCPAAPQAAPCPQAGNGAEQFVLAARLPKKPKGRHDNFAHLDPDDQQLVRKLGGILRLADGLDRRRNRAVDSITCTMTGNCFTIDLHGSGNLSVEVYGGQAKGDLFAAVFGRELLIRSVSATA